MAKTITATAAIAFPASVGRTIDSIVKAETRLDGQYVKLAATVHVARTRFNEELEVAAKEVGGKVARGSRATVASILADLEAQFPQVARINVELLKQTVSRVAKLAGAGIEIPESTTELNAAYREILAQEKEAKEARAAAREADSVSRASHTATESGAATIGDDVDADTTAPAPAKDEPTTTDAPSVDVVAALDHLSALIDRLMDADMTSAERARFASIVSRASRKTKSRA